MSKRREERTLQDLPTKFIICRANRHDWTHVTDDEIVYNGKTIIQHKEHFKCRRCPATKWRLMETNTGDILKQGGTRDPGYGLPYRPTTAEVRVEAFWRRYRKK